MMTLGERVRAEREAKIPKWSQAELARRVSLLLRRKISQVAIHHVEARGNTNPRFVVELAQVLGVTLLWLRTGRGPKYAAKDGQDDMRKNDVSQAGHEIEVPLRSEMRRDVPILGTVSGGRGDWQMNGDAMDWALRPPRLEGRSDIFGLYVEDLSMAPAHKPGSLILVEKLRPPSAGDDVVIEYHDEKDDLCAILKRLVAQTSTALKVEQYNPAKVFDIPREKVVHIYRVMSLVDLLGS